MTDAIAEHPVPSADHLDPSTDPSDLSAAELDALTAPGDLRPDGRPSEAPSPGAVVKGRINVADEVVEKIAALAALEVAGVVDMGGDLARAFESVRDRIGIGSRRGNQGVSAQIQDRQVTVSLTIVVEYGHVVMEVASDVKANVARSVSHMLGMRVVEVNVTVDDVRLPGEARPAPQTPREDEETPFPT
ncbi:Asp23/Gls24 family envelope stress response protein [Nonomuraea sp. M3C6]|uniref:Asp23/Gls24 family envelope stress response protein n=1 Tax=Nonomuraea marmarensis TaxID=3351344 RepID=A0ABW7ARR1_9ACTN